ncbi:acyltransferase family protein [Acidisoma silvae]|uniref:Acyltransferase n=1 Tax=Acidisoma silvae TaxID=2802396 RepID=A0A963YUK8_9PROT|nr:acyltransferase [Acidisoma silvae]MCB8877318.1 acyltransferase [Acidisoma silvae]
MTADRSTLATRAASAYLPEVDALRCLAMLAVIAIHSGLFPFGWTGVWLFFVISGFAVTSSLFSAKHAQHSVTRRIVNFFARRAFRIWPIYFGYIAVSAIFILAFRTPGDLAEVPWLLTFTQNIKMIIESYAPGTVWGGFAHLWTLSDEQQFYVVFPFVLLLPNRRLRTIALVGVILLAPVIRYAVASWSLDQHYDALHAAFAVYAFGPGHFDAFAAGSLIALYRQEIAANIRYAQVAAVVALAISVAYVLTYVLVNIRLSGHVSVSDTRNVLSGVLFGQGRQIWVYYVPTSLGVALLMGILVRNSALLRICNLPGLQAIGRISYGGYLYHVPVLMILGALVPALSPPITGASSYLAHILLFFATAALTVFAASLSYQYLEQPFNRFAQRRMG